MNEQNNNNKSSNTALIVIICLLVVAFIAFGFLIYYIVNLSHEVKDVVEDSFDIFIDDDSDLYNEGAEDSVPAPDFPEDFEDFEGDPENLTINKFDYNGQDIEIEAHIAKVDVYSSHPATNKIEVTLYKSENLNFDISEKDGEIKISEIPLVQDKPILNDQSFISISVPEGYDDSIEIDCTSGNITISELNNLDELECETVSGIIQIEDSSAIEADVSSVSGQITLEGCEIEDCELSTTSGQISSGYCDFATISMASISGSFKLDYNDFEILQLATTSGDCNASLNGSKSDYSVDFASLSGKLHGHGYEGGNKQIRFASTSGSLYLTCE